MKSFCEIIIITMPSRLSSASFCACVGCEYYEFTVPRPRNQLQKPTRRRRQIPYHSPLATRNSICLSVHNRIGNNIRGRCARSLFCHNGAHIFTQVGRRALRMDKRRKRLTRVILETDRRRAVICLVPL